MDDLVALENQNFRYPNNLNAITGNLSKSEQKINNALTNFSNLPTVSQSTPWAAR